MDLPRPPTPQATWGGHARAKRTPRLPAQEAERLLPGAKVRTPDTELTTSSLSEKREGALGNWQPEPEVGTRKGYLQSEWLRARVRAERRSGDATRPAHAAWMFAWGVGSPFKLGKGQIKASW